MNDGLSFQLAKENRRNLINSINGYEKSLGRAWNQLKFGESLASSGLHHISDVGDQIMNQDLSRCNDIANLSLSFILFLN